jgi:GNAT superfamily N-acetyltransferase
VTLGSDIQVRLLTQAGPEFRDHLHQQIRAFNDSVSEYHREIRPVGPEPLDMVLEDEGGRIVGGLAASTYWAWLSLDDLWLEEAKRGQGYGTRLLAEVEAEAIRRGCCRAKVETYGFQARGFYEKQGYRVVGRLDDYPPGQTFYWMRKELAEESRG